MLQSTKEDKIQNDEKTSSMVSRKTSLNDRSNSIAGSVKTSDDDGSVSSMDSTPTPSLMKVLTLSRPEYPILLAAVGLMIVGESIGMINPIFLGNAYDYLINPTLDNSTRMNKVSSTMALILLLHAVACLTAFIHVAVLEIIGERVVARVRTTLYQSILDQEIAFFDRHQSGELISRLSSDTALLQEGTSKALPEVCIGIIKVVVALAIMFWISPKLAAVMLGFVGMVLCLAVPFGTLLATLSKRYQNVLGDATGFTAEALQAMRTVQSFGAEYHEYTRYLSKIGNPMDFKYWYPTKANPDDIDTTYRIGFFKSIVTSGLFTIIFGVGFAGMYFCLWYGFKLVTDGDITVGDLTAFQSYIFIIGGSLGQTSQALSKLIEAKGIAGRVFYLLERIPLIPSPESDNKHGPESHDGTNGNTIVDLSSIQDDAEIGILKNRTVKQQPSEIYGSIDFKDVTFAYPSRPSLNVLENFTLSVPANQTTALVGASGSGKSTCIALLQRFYDVTSGAIVLDGRYDIRHLDLQWLRLQMAYVQQEPQLFGISVRDNILYGVANKDLITDDQIIEITKTANAHDFISKWPKGYDTLVGERGVKLSGGQKQRIAIARALMRQPKILLLDEATSALDAESEHLVQQAIDNAILGRTVVIVAHRLSTIQRASQIVVVDEHHIVDIGSHADLLLRCTKYQELIKRQAILSGNNGIHSSSVNGTHPQQQDQIQTRTGPVRGDSFDSEISI